jgi:hypothetical protein
MQHMTLDNSKLQFKCTWQFRTPTSTDLKIDETISSIEDFLSILAESFPSVITAPLFSCLEVHPEVIWTAKTQDWV